MVNATGVWADRIRPEEIHDEAEVPRIAPSRGTHVTVSMDELPLRQGRLHRPGGRGPHDLRPALVRADADRDHRQRLLRRHRPRAARRRRHRLPARRGQRLLRHRPRPRRPDRRLRRRAAADLDRRPAQVGRHLAQGGALRDLLGDADDHRRQADHLAADGQAGRRPDGRARGPRGARAAPTTSRSGWRPPTHELEPPEGLAEDDLPAGLPRAARVPLRPRAAQRARASPASAPSSPRRSSTASPTCSPRRWSPPASSRRAASPTCSCAAPGSGCSPRPQLRTADSVAPGRRGARRRARLGRRAGARRRPSAGSTDAAAEGIDPARDRLVCDRAPPRRRRFVSLPARWPQSSKDLHLADLHAARGRRRDRRLPPACAARQLIERLRSGRTDGSLGARRSRAQAERRSAAERRRRRATSRSADDREADTDEMVVVEATVLDDSEEEPVELGPLGPRAATSAPTTRRPRTSAGVLELTRQRYGFLRLGGLTPADGDVYVSAAQVRRCELRTGDEVAGPAREPRRGERHRALVHVDTVNGEEPLDRGAARVRRAARRSCPSAGSRSTRPRRRARSRGRPAGAARLRPARAGPRRAALGPHDAAALARPRRRRRRRPRG